MPAAERQDAPRRRTRSKVPRDNATPADNAGRGVTGMAIETFAPAMNVFRRGPDFAAWLGLSSRLFRLAELDRDPICDQTFKDACWSAGIRNI